MPILISVGLLPRAALPGLDVGSKVHCVNCVNVRDVNETRLARDSKKFLISRIIFVDCREFWKSELDTVISFLLSGESRLTVYKSKRVIKLCQRRRATSPHLLSQCVGVRHSVLLLSMWTIALHRPISCNEYTTPLFAFDRTLRSHYWLLAQMNKSNKLCYAAVMYTLYQE